VAAAAAAAAVLLIEDLLSTMQGLRLCGWGWD
jgi:hypothetical protein